MDRDRTRAAAATPPSRKCWQRRSPPGDKYKGPQRWSLHLVAGGKNPPEDYHHNNDIKHKAGHDIENRKPTSMSAQIQHAMEEGRNRQHQRGTHETAPETDHVHAKHNRGTSQHPEYVVAEHRIFGIGIENQGGQKKEEQQEKLSPSQ